MWWTNLFKDMSSTSFFNFSFLPAYTGYFLQGMAYTLLLAVVSVALAVIPALLLALMRLSKKRPFSAFPAHTLLYSAPLPCWYSFPLSTLACSLRSPFPESLFWGLWI